MTRKVYLFLQPGQLQSYIDILFDEYDGIYEHAIFLEDKVIIREVSHEACEIIYFIFNIQF